MAKRRPRPESAPSRGASADAVIPLAILTSARATSPAHSLSTAQRVLLRQLRKEVDSRASGGEFDPRNVLGLSGSGLEAWKRRRTVWVTKQFIGDPRVSR